MRTAALVLTCLAAVPTGSAAAQACQRPDVVLDSRMGTVARTVRNPTSALLRARATLWLPKGWRLALGADAFDVAEGESTTWVGGLLVPSADSAGLYALPLTIRTVSAGEILLNDIVCLQLPRRHAVTTRIAAPAVVIAGDTAVFRVAVRNVGNTALQVRLEPRASVQFAESAPEASVRLRWIHDPVRIAVGDSAIVHVTARLPRDLSRSGVLRLSTTITEVARGALVGEADVRALAVPRPGQGLQQAPMLALTVTSRAGAGGAIAPFEMVGTSALGPRAHLDLLARAPTTGFSPLGERSEYRVAYRDQTTQVRFGDHTVALSPLLQRGQALFGASAVWDTRQATTTAFAGRDRWWRGGGAQAGARTALRRGADAFAVSAFHRNASTRDDGTAIAVAGTHQGRRLSIDLEAAGSRARGVTSRAPADSGGPGSALGWAFRARGGVRGDRADVDAEWIRAAASFPGDMRGAETRAVDVRVVAGRSTVALTLCDDATNGATLLVPRYAVGAITLPSERRRLVSAAWTLPSGVSVTAQSSTRVGQSGTFRYDGSESLLRAHAGVRRTRASVGALRVDLDLDVGTRRDAVRVVHGAFRRVAAHVDLSVGRAMDLRGFAERESGQPLFGGTARSGAVGLEGALRLPRRFDVLVTGVRSAQQTALDGALPLRNIVRIGQFDVTLRRAFGDATLALRARQLQTDLPIAGSMGTQSRIAYLEFRAPLGARLPIRRGLPDERVRVLDDATGRPLRGALIRRGDAIGLTASNGEARLPGLARVGPESPPVELLAAPPDRPDLVALHSRAAEVPRGQTRVLRVASMARVRGLVRGDDNAVLGAARVTLTNGRDTLFTQSDATGAFALPRVVPGRWQIIAAWPHPDGSARTAWDSVDVGANAVASVALTLRAKARTIRPLPVVPPAVRMLPFPEPSLSDSTRAGSNSGAIRQSARKPSSPARTARTALTSQRPYTLRR